MDLVIFSIGNPGPLNRHSAGHWVLGELISGFGAKQLVKKSTYSITSYENITFVKSNTYMNESHTLFKQFISNERVGNATVCILYDDFELDMPKVRLGPFKKSESHNGVRSIQNLNPPNTYKLGVGIGPKPQLASKDTMASWVLSRFKQEELEKLKEHSVPLVFAYISELFVDEIDCNKINAKCSKKVKE